MRIKKSDLDSQVRLLNDVTGDDYSLDWAYGGVRVQRASESINVTWRGSKRDVYAMLGGMIHVALRLQKTT